VILVSAAAPQAPEPLLDQLSDAGRLIIPLGDRDNQRLTVIRREGGRFERESQSDVRFVPLIGQFGFEGLT
jgi:protein-L-isoaspartate(D-aspartate) O-methyltransferase